LPGDLAAHGIEVRIAVVYRAVKIERFPAELQADIAAGRISGVLHYSARSAEAFLECARAADLLDRALQGVHYCLSPRVAEPLRIAGASDIRIAAVPEENGLINLVVA